MRIKDYSEKLQPFVFHGVDCQPVTTGQSISECPFCGASDKFGIAVATGQFRCVRCETSGNIYSFLEQYHRLCYEATTIEDYQNLADDRGLSVIGLRSWGLAKSILKGDWLIPGANERGKMANLYRVFESEVEEFHEVAVHTNNGLATGKKVMTSVKKRKYQSAATPGCKIQPMGTSLLRPNQKRRYILEGPWDGIALWDYLRRHTLRGTRLVRLPDTQVGPESFARTDLLSQIPAGCLLETQGAWSAPAAGNFQSEWLHLFHEFDNVIVFDNDYPKKYPDGHPMAGKYMLQDSKCKRPGYDGELRILDLLAESRNVKPERTSYIVWGPGSPAPGKCPNCQGSGEHSHNNKDCDLCKGTGRITQAENYIPQLSEPGHDPNLADGYDVRDCIKEHGTSTLDVITPLLVEYKPSRRRAVRKDTPENASGVKPISRTSFAETCIDFDSRLHYSSPMRDTFAVMLAVIISTELPEDPVWLRVIGPPGSGKTTLAECVSVAREWVMPKSILTGLVSGYTDPTDRDKDCSPLKLMLGKTVIVKDADTIIKSPKRDAIMSQLRDAYDGATRVSYLTGRENQDYENIRITFILCGTDALRQLSRDTYLGERFLDCEIMDETIDHRPILDRAQSNAQSALTRYFASPSKEEVDSPDHEVHSDDNAMFLKQSTYGLLKYYKDNFRGLPVPEFNAVADKRILAMAEFLSMMRARVEHSKNELDYRPRAEVAGRLVKQFTKLAFCLAIVTGKTIIDDEVIRLCQKVMMDTAKGYQRDITLLLINHPHGLSTTQIFTELQISETSARHWMQDMQELKIIKRAAASNKSGQRGRDLHLWHVQPRIIETWNILNPGVPNAKPSRKPRRPSRSH